MFVKDSDVRVNIANKLRRTNTIGFINPPTMRLNYIIPCSLYVRFWECNPYGTDQAINTLLKSYKHLRLTENEPL